MEILFLFQWIISSSNSCFISVLVRYSPENSIPKYHGTYFCSEPRIPPKKMILRRTQEGGSEYLWFLENTMGQNQGNQDQRSWKCGKYEMKYNKRNSYITLMTPQKNHERLLENGHFLFSLYSYITNISLFTETQTNWPNFHHCSLCLSVFPSPPTQFDSVISYIFFINICSILQENLHNIFFPSVSCVM